MSWPTFSSALSVFIVCSTHRSAARSSVNGSRGPAVRAAVTAADASTPATNTRPNEEKTTLVRGVLRARGWEGSVKSPTYTLVENYPISSLYFYHFDFYRFDDPDEWDSTGFAEYFRPDSIAVIEWPERVAARLPRVDVDARLGLAEPGRALELRAATAAGEACLARFATLMA